MQLWEQLSGLGIVCFAFLAYFCIYLQRKRLPVHLIFATCAAACLYAFPAWLFGFQAKILPLSVLIPSAIFLVIGLAIGFAFRFVSKKRYTQNGQPNPEHYAALLQLDSYSVLAQELVEDLEKGIFSNSQCFTSLFPGCKREKIVSLLAYILSIEKLTYTAREFFEETLSSLR